MDLIKDYKFIPATGESRPTAISLLQENGLPVSDLDDHKHLFTLLLKEEIVGTGGLEIFKDCTLVRSISVKKKYRGIGLGKLIINELEKICADRNITQLYLFTTTAKSFFDKAGYIVVAREDAPLPIKKSSEFSTVCPSSAVVMKKIL
jgi:amino-acid N-acetyltransferase